MAPATRYPLSTEGSRTSRYHAERQSTLAHRPAAMGHPQASGQTEQLAGQDPVSKQYLAHRISNERQNRHAHTPLPSTIPRPVNERSYFLECNREAVDAPDVVVSLASDDDHERQLCEGYPCPFFDHDPRQYARCMMNCTQRGVDGAHSLRRHLQAHHANDAPCERLEAAIAKLKVQDKSNRSLDGRRHQAEDSVVFRDKLEVMYKRARKELFGTDEARIAQRCQLPYRHVQRRCRSSNKTSDAQSERSSHHKRRQQASRTTSRASSTTNLESLSSVDEEVIDTESHESYHPVHVVYQEMYLQRIEAPSLPGLFERIESQLNHFDRKVWRGAINPNDALMQPSNDNGHMQATAITTNAFLPRRVHGQDSHLFQTAHQPIELGPSEMDLDLMMVSNNPSVALSSAQVVATTEPHVPSQQTWQEQTFGNRDRSANRSMHIDYMTTSAELRTPRASQQAAVPSLTSRGTRSSRMFATNLPPQTPSGPTTEGYESSMNSLVNNCWPRQQYLDPLCSICGQQLAHCGHFQAHMTDFN